MIAYFATAAICCIAAVAAQANLPERIGSPQSETRFWIMLTIVMAFLGLNKQLDLQTLFTQIGRYSAHSGGWYDQRQTVQTLFILGLTCAAIVTAFILLWIFRRLAVEIRIAALGLCLLIAFVIIRAASFHHTDKFLGENVIGLRWNSLLELSSIFFVAAAGIWYRINRPTNS